MAIQLAGSYQYVHYLEPDSINTYTYIRTLCMYGYHYSYNRFSINQCSRLFVEAAAAAADVHSLLLM